MRKSVKPKVIIDAVLNDGIAFGMGGGAYLVVQHDEERGRQAVLITVEDMGAIIGVERARGEPQRGVKSL